MRSSLIALSLCLVLVACKKDEKESPETKSTAVEQPVANEATRGVEAKEPAVKAEPRDPLLERGAYLMGPMGCENRHTPWVRRAWT